MGSARRAVSAFAIAVALAASATACSTVEPQPDLLHTAGASTSFPDGYRDALNGVAYAFVSPPECIDARCSQVRLFAYKDCPVQVYVEANLLDANGTIIGTTDDTAGAMHAGDQATATLRATISSATRVELTKVECR